MISIAATGGSVEVLFSDGQTAAATITGRDPQTDLEVPGENDQAVTAGGSAAQGHSATTKVTLAAQP